MQSLLHHLKNIPLIYGLIALPAGAFAGNYSQTCRNFSLDGSTLFTHCEDRQGANHTSAIDLNQSAINLKNFNRCRMGA